MNRQRSATAGRIYRSDARLEIRSAGVRADAMNRVSEADVTWANVIFTMETEHKTWIENRFEGLDIPTIHVLGIPDEFEKMDLRLKLLLRSSIEPLLRRHLENPKKS